MKVTLTRANGNGHPWANEKWPPLGQMFKDTPNEKMAPTGANAQRHTKWSKGRREHQSSTQSRPKTNKGGRGEGKKKQTRREEKMAPLEQMREYTPKGLKDGVITNPPDKTAPNHPTKTNPIHHK